ncbi:immunoglobulin V-set domain-containing protein isoform X2 [Amphiprion ocellaris]|uniref:immunoglobulin V-set domain-containing protein isoform X2 n=1 Tax=Amphiprion ocellaris TaxID=80972 RepID=UPI000C308905|nr:immunoglobulin V-set domain-containing protein isoform X2 [Amphiprion ocellaris]
MSEVWLRIIAVVSVCCSALSQAEDRGVVWRDVGESVTIQCRTPADQEYLYLRMGLSEDTDVFFTEKASGKITISKQYQYRLQSDGKFPNVDILIKNLTANDTGPYWCMYKVFDRKIHKPVSTKGSGSVLLVVTRDKHAARATSTAPPCDASHQDLVMVSVVISAAVLLCILMAFLIMIILKTKSLRASVAPRRLPTNDVYEDMRGTFRR